MRFLQYCQTFQSPICFFLQFHQEFVAWPVHRTQVLEQWDVTSWSRDRVDRFHRCCTVDRSSLPHLPWACYLLGTHLPFPSGDESGFKPLNAHSTHHRQIFTQRDCHIINTVSTFSVSFVLVPVFASRLEPISCVLSLSESVPSQFRARHSRFRVQTRVFEHFLAPGPISEHFRVIDCYHAFSNHCTHLRSPTPVFESYQVSLPTNACF